MEKYDKLMADHLELSRKHKEQEEQTLAFKEKSIDLKIRLQRAENRL